MEHLRGRVVGHIGWRPERAELIRWKKMSPIAQITHNPKRFASDHHGFIDGVIRLGLGGVVLSTLTSAVLNRETLATFFLESFDRAVSAPATFSSGFYEQYPPKEKKDTHPTEDEQYAKMAYAILTGSNLNMNESSIQEIMAADGLELDTFKPFPQKTIFEDAVYPGILHLRFPVAATPQNENKYGELKVGATEWGKDVVGYGVVIVRQKLTNEALVAVITDPYRLVRVSESQKPLSPNVFKINDDQYEIREPAYAPIGAIDRRGFHLYAKDKSLQQIVHDAVLSYFQRHPQIGQTHVQSGVGNK